MLFSQTFEYGLIVIGLLWAIDQLFDSFIHMGEALTALRLYDITLAYELKEKELNEPEISDEVKKIYS